MGLDFGASVSINNILALKAIHTFLFNYNLHEAPSFLETLWIPSFRKWVEKKAIQMIEELLTNPSAKAASLSLNDVSSEMFSVLYCVHNPQEIVNVKTGQELFMVLAGMTLEFEKLKKPHLNKNITQEG